MEIKRYDLEKEIGDNCSCEMFEDPCGNYYRRTDVEANMIPKPDPEEAMEMVNDLIENVRLEGIESLWPAEPRTYYLKAALLRLMGVE